MEEIAIAGSIDELIVGGPDLSFQLAKRFFDVLGDFAFHFRSCLMPGGLFQNADPLRKAFEVREDKRTTGDFGPLIAQPQIRRQITLGRDRGGLRPILRGRARSGRVEKVPQVVGHVLARRVAIRRALG